MVRIDIAFVNPHYLLYQMDYIASLLVCLMVGYVTGKQLLSAIVALYALNAGFQPTQIALSSVIIIILELLFGVFERSK